MNPALIATAVLAANVTLAWDPSPDAVSYRLYISIQPIDGDPALQWYPTTDTSFEVMGLDFGTKYYFRATAFNSQGIESAYSNEVSWTATPPPTPTPTPQATPEPTATPTPTPSRHHHWQK